MGKTSEPVSARASRVRLSITQKLIAGYAAMAFFTLVALLFSFYGLLGINKTARGIANSDLPALSSLTKLRSAVLAQEGYAGKYVIFKSPEFIDLFHQREQEAREAIALLEESGSVKEARVLDAMYRQYNSAAARLFSGTTSDTKGARSSALRLLDTVDSLYKTRQEHLQAKLHSAERKELFTIQGTVTISLLGLALALAVAGIVTYRISSAIKGLRKATHRIADGDFDHDPQIPKGDEIGDLAGDFLRMAERLKALERASLDASPLTRLPGNIAIERAIDERLLSGKRFAFCYADLDNFKAYSDRYGYAKGSELIRLSGDIIQQAVKEHDPVDGFVGHIGGDDFVMVVSDTRAQAVCEAVISAFDAEVVKHYTEEDLQNRGIQGFDRYGVQRFFPVMSISIAVVICSGAELSSAVELARASAELKDYVKEKPGSSYSIKQYTPDK